MEHFQLTLGIRHLSAVLLEKSSVDEQDPSLPKSTKFRVGSHSALARSSTNSSAKTCRYLLFLWKMVLEKEFRVHVVVHACWQEQSCVDSKRASMSLWYLFAAQKLTKHKNIMKLCSSFFSIKIPSRVDSY